VSSEAKFPFEQADISAFKVFSDGHVKRIKDPGTHLILDEDGFFESSPVVAWDGQGKMTRAFMERPKSEFRT
jgi:hypothetical protein